MPIRGQPSGLIDDRCPESARRLLRQFAGTSRYELVRFLGQGAFGIVFEAHDHERDARLALKVLYHDQVAALRRFKNEFRALADIAHPNLVMLFDLSAYEGTWFLTMELVEGVSFLEHVWRSVPRTLPKTATLSVSEVPLGAGTTDERGDPSTLDRSRLRDALLQLTQGISALHRARRLHRDLKPSNVLVGGDGRLVILDFGMVGDLNEHRSPLTGIVGTPGYIAPELARGEAATEATDWYAVGAMLHEALTGRLPVPHHGDRGGDTFGSSGDDELFALCRDLLDDDPAKRPGGAELAARLGHERGAVRYERGGRPFVGRDEEKGILRAALEEAKAGTPSGVILTGASGIGKSALVRHCLEEVRAAEPNVIVLSGRCYERESVPYKAFDELIDALAQYLQSLDAAEIHDACPPQMRALARLFPSLRPIADRVPESDDSPEAPDARELRRQAFRALRTLLARLARRRPLVLAIDDMQWGDPDSVALLEELLRPPDSPPLLFVVTHRDMLDQSVPVLALLERALEATGTSWKRVALSGLSIQDARELADAMLPHSGSRALQMDVLVRESHGSPLFLKQLAERVSSQGASWEDAPVALPDIIREQVADLPTASSHLVELLSVAGRPLARDLALEIAGVERGVAQPSVLHAVNAHLLLTRGGAEGMLLEPAHDKVRESVASGLAPDRTRFWHKRIAETLRRLPAADPEVLVEHFLGAGEDLEAGRFALRAALHANEVLAFDRAAEHLALALRLPIPDGTSSSQLLSLRAEALANSGRGGEAADCFRDAATALSAEHVGHPDVLLLRRRAGEHYLRSGRIDDGMTAMNDVLKESGLALPSTRTRALASMAVKRARLLARGTAFAPRSQASISDRQRARLEVLWSATTSISMLNFVVADPLGVEHLLEALAAGDPSHVIRGLGYEAAFEAVLGGSFFNARCKRLLDQMDQMARESDVPYDRAWARMARGITSWSLGDFATVVRMCDEAERLYRERCRGVAWELAVIDAFCLQSLASLGRIAELTRRVPERLRAAEKRGDLFAANVLRLGHPNMIHLVADEPDRALDEARRGFAPIPKETYLTPHYHFLLASCQAELYQGDGPSAFARIEAEWPRVKSAQFLRAQCLRLEIRHLCARSALAAAAHQSNPRARGRLLERAAHEASVIRRDDLPLGRPLADLIAGGIARARGNDDAALRLAGDCIDRFAALGLDLYREAARFCHGALLGGDAGSAEVQASTAWMENEGIVNPRAITAMLAPGLLPS